MIQIGSTILTFRVTNVAVTTETAPTRAAH